MIPSFLDKTKLVHKPGVYIYFDNQRTVIYVGKAIDLSKRVASYFNGQPDSLKTQTLVTRIASLDTIVVESELEALILEASLIKKYLPEFNIRLTDDKDYLYVKVTKGAFPQIVTARKNDLDGSLDYFGPFPSSNVVKQTLKTLRRVFPWCSKPPRKSSAVSCQRSAVNLKSGKACFLESHDLAKTGFKACFYYHLGLCPGPCVGKISAADYQKIISRFRRFMNGQKADLVEELTKEMVGASKEMDFEQAARVKRIIDGINYMTQSNQVAVYLENPNFLEDQRQSAIEELRADLNLSTLPQRIECYDISNLQGKQATGSMVVLTNGEIDKSQYRRFKIKISGKANDFAMHAEMMRRRLNNLDWPLPDLFLIDGGRGQVRASAVELAKKGITRPIFGLAKRMEWLYPVEGEIIKLPKRSLSLRLLQKIRNESHRFAINYHRKLREREAFITR